jgi:hypothetical protein
MKKEILGLAAALLAGAIASPALADVTVTATITKHKDISVSETVTITKVAVIEAAVSLTNAPNAAEALSLANVNNDHNVVDRNSPGVGVDATIHRTSSITGATTDSVSNNHGGVGVNQDSGDNSNLGNLVSFGETQNGQAFTNGEASVDQKDTNNRVQWGPEGVNVPTNGSHNLLDITLNANISDAVNTNTGIVGLNQNAGNNNNQTNAVAAAVGLAVANTNGVLGGIALAESDLGQVNSGNTVSEFHATKTALIENSVDGNIGVVGVNQSVGNNSNQANVVSIAATLAP